MCASHQEDLQASCGQGLHLKCISICGSHGITGAVVILYLQFYSNLFCYKTYIHFKDITYKLSLYNEIIGTVSNPYIMLLTSLLDKYITFHNGDELYV